MVGREGAIRMGRCFLVVVLSAHISLGSQDPSPLYLKTPFKGMEIDTTAVLQQELPDLMKAVKPVSVQPPHFHPPFAAKPGFSLDTHKPQLSSAMTRTPSRSGFLAESLGSPPDKIIPLPTKADGAFSAAQAMVKLANHEEQCQAVKKLCPVPNPEPAKEENCRKAQKKCQDSFSASRLKICNEHSGGRAPVRAVDVAQQTQSTKSKINATAALNISESIPISDETTAPPDVTPSKSAEGGTSNTAVETPGGAAPTADVTLLLQEGLQEEVAPDQAQSIAERLGSHQPYSLFNHYMNEADTPLRSKLDVMSRPLLSPSRPHPGQLAESNNAKLSDGNPLDSELMKLDVPELDSILGQASYTKVLCRETKARCDTKTPECAVALHQCELELKRAKGNLCTGKL